MVECIITSFNIWTDAQGVKSKGRVRSIDNISLEGVAHLRELILELAIRGKLVPQDPTDEPASVLLKKIEREKENLAKEGKIKKEKPLREIRDEEKPFALPSGWQWIKLGQIALNVDYGTSEKATDEGEVPILRMGNIQEGKVILKNLKYVQKSIKDLPRLYLKQYDIIFNRTNSFELVGKCGIFQEDTNTFTLASYLIRVSVPLAFVSVDFLNYYINSTNCRTTQIEPQITQQTGQANFSGSKLKEILSPFPPLVEQHRIIAKVEELMALCDKLERKKTASLKTHQTLVSALLQTLIAAKDGGEVEKAWHRLAPHFDTLFCIKDSIDQLKQTILQLAIMGRLVKQNSADEPARELLKKIEREKEKLVKEGKIKKEKPLPEIKEEEKPFMLPNGWEWVRLGEISNKIGSGSTPRGGANAYTTSGTIFLRSQNIRNEGLQLDDVVYIDDDTNSKMSNTVVQPFDILLNITGGSLGRSTVFPEIAENANVSQHVTIIRPTLKSSSTYLHKCILSPYIQDMIWGRQVGANREGLSKRILELFEFPYPPLQEQERIVKKVEELMDICDKLQQRLTKSQEIQNTLSKAIVTSAVA